MTDTINNADILRDYGIGVVHFGPKWQTDEKDRPFTVAFRASGDLIEISTAIVHPKDKFIRKIGTRTAVDKFLAGDTIIIPVPRHFQRRYAYFLRVLFAV